MRKTRLWQPLLSPRKTLPLVESDFFTPQTFSRVEKRGEGSSAWPLPSAGSDHRSERESRQRCACTGTDTPGHRNNRGSTQAATSPSTLPGTLPGTLLCTGTTQARARGKHWGGRGVSGFHHPVTSRRDTDRWTEGQSHGIKAWNLLLGPGMPVTACFDGT